MSATAIKILVIVIGSSLLASPRQFAPWTSHMKAGKKAWNKRDYSQAEREYLAAIQLTESFGLEDRHLGKTLPPLVRVLEKHYPDYLRIDHVARLANHAKAGSLRAEHPDVRWALNNIAQTFFDLGRNDEAESLYQYALRIYSKSPQISIDHRRAASSYRGLAQLNNKRQRFEEAAFQYQKTIALWELCLEPREHHEMAKDILELANLYFTVGQYSKAEPLYQRAIVIWESTFGPENSPAELARHNYTLLKLVASGRVAEAIELQRRRKAAEKKP